jgi:hypothetical protein
MPAGLLLLLLTLKQKQYLVWFLFYQILLASSD